MSLGRSNKKNDLSYFCLSLSKYVITPCLCTEIKGTVLLMQTVKHRIHNLLIFLIYTLILFLDKIVKKMLFLDNAHLPPVVELYVICIPSLFYVSVWIYE